MLKGAQNTYDLEYGALPIPTRLCARQDSGVSDVEMQGGKYFTTKLLQIDLSKCLIFLNPRHRMGWVSNHIASI